MIAISIVVVMRISRDFSSFSAICPAVAENRKYGRMKIAGASEAYSVRCDGYACIQNSRPMIACLNTLSLKAPKHWVAKNGRNRRCFNSVNCECPAWPLSMHVLPARIFAQAFPRQWQHVLQPPRRSPMNALLKTLTVLAAGAAAMYSLDPSEGRRRRTLVKDKGTSAGRNLTDSATA